VARPIGDRLRLLAAAWLLLALPLLCDFSGAGALRSAPTPSSDSQALDAVTPARDASGATAIDPHAPATALASPATAGPLLVDAAGALPVPQRSVAPEWCATPPAPNSAGLVAGAPGLVLPAATAPAVAAAPCLRAGLSTPHAPASLVLSPVAPPPRPLI